MDEETKKLMLEGILATLAGVDLQLAVIDPYKPDEEEKPSRGGAAHYLVGRCHVNDHQGTDRQRYGIALSLPIQSTRGSGW